MTRDRSQVKQLELFGPNYKPACVVYCYSCARSFFWSYAQHKKACPHCGMAWKWKGWLEKEENKVVP